MIAVPISTQMMLMNRLRRSLSTEIGGASGSSFRPCSAKRCCASRSVNPLSRLNHKTGSSASGARVFHSRKFMSSQTMKSSSADVPPIHLL